MSRQKKRSPFASAEGSSRGVTADANLVYGDFLYVGHVTAASNMTFLRHKCITDVVSIGKKPGKLPPGVQNKVIGLNNSASVTPERFFEVCDEAASIIDDVVRYNEEQQEKKIVTQQKMRKVLVHCLGGISRSPSVVIAYLMRYQGYSLLQALAQVWSQRPKVLPNNEFIKYLEDFETKALRRNPSLTIQEFPKTSEGRKKLLQNVPLPI